MANISGAVQIETGIKHRLSIPVQSVAVEQSIDVGTLLGLHQGSKTDNSRHKEAICRHQGRDRGAEFVVLSEAIR
jgi:hypothetical protein